MDEPPNNDNPDSAASIDQVDADTADAVVMLAPMIAKRLQARALYWRGPLAECLRMQHF